MYDVLVVDDELLVCEGIADYLLNSGLDIAQVHVALNGFEALDYIRMESIDLVLTDIQMGEMNGIQLMEAILIEEPELPVIVISAHEQFHYAQQAMRYGAKDYLIKPVSLDTLTEVVGKNLNQNKRKQKDWIDKIRDKYSIESYSLFKNSILSKMMFEPVIEKHVIQDMLKPFGVQFTGVYFSIFVVQLIIDPKKLKQYRLDSFLDRNLIKYAASNIMEETLSEFAPVVFDSTNNVMVAIMQWNKETFNHMKDENVTKHHLLANSLHSNLRHYLKLDSNIGISRVGHRLESLPVLFKEGMEAISWKRVHPDQNVFYVEDFSHYSAADSLDQLGETDLNVIQSVLRYVHDSFRNKDLKLQDIAKVVHYSPNYLSYQFTKLVGVSLWDYVTNLRMEEAKKLLLTTEKKRYEIAFEIGYESPEHFGRIFKRMYGISPSEYREKSGKNIAANSKEEKFK